MRKIVRRRPQRQVIGFEPLEGRKLLAIAILAIDNGFDFVGSDLSDGGRKGVRSPNGGSGKVNGATSNSKRRFKFAIRTAPCPVI